MDLIRPVTPEELPLLLDLIRELARFEKLEHEVIATPEALHESLFGPQPVAGGLLAFSGDAPAGYALYFFTFSSFNGRPGIWLEDLYVRPQFRHRGLGKGLIQRVAKVGADRDCRRFEWTALNWNTNAIQFYHKLGARTLDEWLTLRCEADVLRKLAAESGL